MLRGGAGSRGAAAKPPRCPHPRPPSRRARGTAAAPAPKGGGLAAALEEPVVSSVEESSFTFEFKRGSNRARKAMPPAEAHRGKENWGEGLSNKSKPNAVPAKAPATKEVPEEVEFTHCAPSIVARLMGLDTVPRSKKVLDRCQSDIQRNMRLKLSGGVQEVGRVSCDDRPCRSSADELPELKDVFEVTDMENMAMRKELQSDSEKTRRRSNDADLEFVRRKFLDAKRLSTDEGHRNSKEFGEALEILYSKKDVFLEILQESSTALSGFPGHILGYGGFQGSPHTSNGTDAQLFGQENLCRLEVDCESEDSLSSVHLKETSVAPLEHLAPNGSKSSGKCSHIVVLKPDLRRRSLTPVLSSQESEQFGQWTGTQWLKPPRCSMYKEDFIHSTAPKNVQFLEPEGDTPEHKVQLEPTTSWGLLRKDVYGPSKYTGLLQATKDILREEGLPGFWRGNVPALFMYMPYTAIQFTVLHKLKTFASGSSRTEDHLHLSPYLSYVSGAIAGCAATVGSYPFDLLRTICRTSSVGRLHL